MAVVIALVSLGLMSISFRTLSTIRNTAGLPLTISYAPFLALAATVALTVYVVRARVTSSS